MADALSRPPAPIHTDQDPEGDLDDWCDAQINATSIDHIGKPLLDPEFEWSALSNQYANFLLNGIVPHHLSPKWRAYFKAEALKYKVIDGILWRKEEGRLPRRRVVDDPDLKRRILRNCHATFGHKGRDSTKARIQRLYYWKGLHRDVMDAVSQCLRCAQYDPKTYGQSITPTTPGQPFETIRLDVQHMRPCRGYIYLVEARCDLTGFVVAQPLRVANARTVKKFFIEEILTQFGCPLKVSTDGGPENKAEFASFLKAIGVLHVQISPYNPRAQGLVESGHFPITQSLSKLSEQGDDWVKYLNIVLFADRTTVRRSHGCTPFYLIYGWEPIIPIETEIPTWRILSWKPDQTVEEAMEFRFRMLANKAADVDKAIEAVRLFRQRQASKSKDTSYTRNKPLEPGDTVLVYDHVRRMDHSTTAKMAYRWKGPFVVDHALQKNAYRLRTSDGALLHGIYAARNLKLFRHNPDLNMWEPAVPMPWDEDPELNSNPSLSHKLQHLTLGPYDNVDDNTISPSPAIQNGPDQPEAQLPGPPFAASDMPLADDDNISDHDTISDIDIRHSYPRQTRAQHKETSEQAKAAQDNWYIEIPSRKIPHP